MPKQRTVKINFKSLNENHFYKIRIENKATRDQENMVKVCKSIIYNLDELINETEEKNKTITEKAGPTGIYTKETGITNNTGRDTQARI